MNVLRTDIAGVLILQPKEFRDARGCFVKTYHYDLFRDLGIPFVPREEFFSVSRANVVRGMHFQLPPSAHDKLVYCAAGRVLDVVLDLRKAGGADRKFFSREISAANREMLFIPSGCAHGFLSLADDTVMVYQTSTVHSPAHDAGILWNSFGFQWPVQEPVLSERDQRFPAFDTFDSPF
jgi:dTDP-4-dehydrorhamnose 3,5-epimerase